MTAKGLNIAATDSAGTSNVKKAPVKLSSIGTTFANMRKEPEKPQYIKEPEIKDTGERNVFTEEEAQLQWVAMCNRMPQSMKGMAARMKNMMPTITSFPNVEVVVDNQILMEQMLQIKSRIRSTLAMTLHNTEITLNLRLAEADEVTKILSRREMFDEMRSKNPALEKLREILDLELI